MSIPQDELVRRTTGTDAIQHLRALWTQFDREAKAAVASILTVQDLRRLRRLRLGSGVLRSAATSCLHRIASEIARLRALVHELDEQLAELVAQSGNALDDVCDAGLQVAATLLAQSGDVRRFRDRWPTTATQAWRSSP